MNTVTDFVQKGFRTSLGAASFLVETLQDPNKRDENLQKLNSNFNSMDFSQLTEEWEEKGETTERDARTFVDNMLNQKSSESTSNSDNLSDFPRNTNNQSAASSNLQQELQELTAEIMALRTELKQYQESKPEN
jgi:polyhydroxyalkanoate synthesis regulator phasin